jgi:hypothetical protein
MRHMEVGGVVIELRQVRDSAMVPPPPNLLTEEEWTNPESILSSGGESLHAKPRHWPK